MWGRHRFAPLTESVKKWASHQEQQDVINSIQEVLGEDPPKRPFVKRLVKSLSFAVMFISLVYLSQITRFAQQSAGFSHHTTIT